ncbi:MAG: hypothetical protein Q9217_000067 [Psora testacea]
MTSILSYRPSTSDTTGSVSGINRQASLSSFPSTRITSNPSVRNGITMANVPPGLRRGSTTSSSTPSTPSSARQTPPKPGTSGPAKKKLRCQYPADTEDKHVEYILVASFDVDQGSIMEHQYPAAISGDENMLAELMLPDQAHARKEDWTIFFLHKDAGEGEDIQEDEDEGEDLKKGDEPSAQGEDDESANIKEQDDAEEGEAPPLIYVLNLVNTKYDSSAKR